MMNVKQMTMLLAAGCVVAGCDVRNPVVENQSSQRALASEPEQAAKKITPPIAKSDDVNNDVKKPVGLNRQQLNERLQKAMRNRVKQQGGQGAGSPPTMRQPPKPKGEAPERPFKSTDFTRIEPDEASTARKAPVAEDLARYTSDLKGKGVLRATIVTSKGKLECTLFEKEAPITVANFVGLSRGLKSWIDPFTGEATVGVPLYQNVLFHRVIPNFMIQGGDPQGDGRGNPGYKIPDEFSPSLKHDKPALLSMANSGPNTGGSQFFVTEVPTPHLDNRHAIFGACDSAELVKEIARVKRGRMDRPEEDVLIKKIEISRAKK